jgi:oxaloacetate decarboxylase (Na+ extruding) subunit gamma
MIAAGLQLMVLGMTIVFTFLILLVLLMTIMSSLLRRFEPASSGVPAGAPGASGLAGGPPAGGAGSFDTHIPAILAAVVAHRKRIGAADNTK